MDRRFWAIIGVIAVVFVGFLWFGGKQEDKKEAGKQSTATNHVTGNTSSKVKLVEYGDYQCPVCASYHPAVKQILVKYKDQIAFQFRNLPLSQMHQHAFAGARAAEAAGMQNRFWEMHDLLYQGQAEWSQSSKPMDYFKLYAKQLGLSASKFEADFASDTVNKAINSDVSEFKKTGSNLATPTFFLNGKKLELKQLTDAQGTPQIEKFSKYIDEALKKQQ